MSFFQNLVKCFAYFLATLIIFSIIFGINSLLVGLGSISDDNHEINKDVTNLECIGDISLSNLKVNLNYSNLKIVTGNLFEVKSNDKNIKCYEEDGYIVIDDSSSMIKTNQSDVIISLPDNVRFDDMDIETGAGSLNIAELYSHKLELNVGAGKTIINSLNAESVEIDTGVGEFNIKAGSVNNIEIDTGVGTSNIKLKIQEYGNFECGVGKVNLDLIGTLDNYKLNLNKGIGKCYVARNELGDNETIGSGMSKIILDGGIGQINVNFIGE